MSALRVPQGVLPVVFRRVWGAHAVSTMGDQISPIALTFALIEAGRPELIAVVLIARTVALAGFAVPGGALGDSWSRRRVMVGADLVRVASQAVAAAAILTGWAPWPLLAATQLVLGAATAAFRPAATGLLPEIVPDEQLQRANGLLGQADSASMLVGPVVAGALVAAATPGIALALDAGTFALSAVLLVGVPSTRRGGAQGRPGLRDQMAEGWRHVVGTAWLRTAIVYFSAFQLFVLGSVYVAGPQVAADHLGGAVAWAAIVASLGAGGLVGAVAATRVAWRSPVMGAVVLPCAFCGILLSLGLGAPVALVCASAAVAGASLTFAEALWATALQRGVEDRLLSRVSAFDWLGSTAGRPIGLALAGVLAATWTPEGVLLIAAGGLASATVAATLVLRRAAS